MRCRHQDLYFAWRLIAALAVPAQSISGRCIITDHSSGQNFTLDASTGSLCCAVAQLHLASRPGGHCPEVTPALPLPFGVQCAKDENLKVLLPDKATSTAAHRLLCDLPGCWPAVLDVVNHAKELSQPIVLPHPNCVVNASHGTIKLQDEQTHVATTEMIVIVISMLMVLVGGIALLHWVITPWWLRSSSRAASPMAKRLEAAGRFSATVAEVREASLQLQLDESAMDAAEASSSVGELFAAAQLSPKNAAATGGLPSPSPPCVECIAPSGDTDSAVHPSPKPIGASASSNIALPDVRSEAVQQTEDLELGPEVIAHARLVEARSSCRARIVLMCAVGIGATLVRVFLSAAGAVGPGMVFIIILCVFQVGSLARTSFMPILSPEVASKGAATLSPIQKWTHACGYLLGDLRVYAGSTIISELIVIIVVASEAFSSNDDSQGDDDSGLAAKHLGNDGLLSAPLRSFMLSQAALTLVLLRFYTAWLAHSLYKLRIELNNVVLPDTPKAPACDEKRAVFEQQIKLNTLMPAWDTPLEASPETSRTCRARLRSSSLFWAALAAILILSAVAIGIWSAYNSKANSEASTCRTATGALDFCVQKSYLGMFTTVGSFEDCCRACDSTQGCQAWSFQKTTGRCWQMRFDSEPCKRWPSHESCRCHTSVDRVAGYRPGAEDMATS